ncbi:hypothetical protein ACQJBY_068612 [Aegilops geniculata]
MGARGPPLRPMPRRPCRRRRLDHHARCRSFEPTPQHGDRHRPSVAGNRRIWTLSNLPRCPSSVPDIFPAPGAQASAATRPCLLCPVARHGGHHLSVSIRPVAASPVSIRLPPDPRRSSRDPPPVPRRLGPPRPAPRPTRRGGRPRPSPSSGRTCGLGSPTASAPASSPPCRPRPPPRRKGYFFKTNSFPDPLNRDCGLISQ